MTTIAQMKIRYVTASLLVALGGACTSSDPLVECAKSVPQTSSESRMLRIAEADAITNDLLVSEIFQRLGPAVRDACSGLYCPEWNVEDGRVLVVRFSSGCGRPLEVHLVNRPTG